MFSRIAVRAVKPAGFSRPISTTAFLARANQGSKGRQMPSTYSRATAQPASGTEATFTIRVSRLGHGQASRKAG